MNTHLKTSILPEQGEDTELQSEGTDVSGPINSSSQAHIDMSDGSDNNHHSSSNHNDINNDEWQGYQEGFDWEMEKARRFLEGPSFAPFRMTLWEPPSVEYKARPPGILESTRILLNNALQMIGLAESLDGAPLVQGVNTYEGSWDKLIAGVSQGNLQELAGMPLFLLLWKYYQEYGPVFKLAFGPKSFIGESHYPSHLL